MKVVFNLCYPIRIKANTLFNLIVKCSAIFFLFSISILIVACSSNSTGQLNLGTPVVTVTIKLGQDVGSPTPTLSPYYCGGWATDTSPAFSTTSTVSVFGKFTKIIDGNPEGVGGATATATIVWPDGTSDTMTTTTTSDGLAVFPVALKPSAINKLVTINIEFTSPQGNMLDTPGCLLHCHLGFTNTHQNRCAISNRLTYTCRIRYAYCNNFTHTYSIDP